MQPRSHLGQLEMDALTRPQFIERLTSEVEASRSRGQRVFLLALDVDHFRDVNDGLGQQVGDRLLMELASRLALKLPPGGVLGHMGADEFCVLHGADVQEARAFIKELEDELAKPYLLNGQLLRIPTSGGIAHYPEHAGDYETLMRRAQTAMAKAKQQGGGMVMFATHLESEVVTADRLTMFTELHAAIELDQLELHFQPQVELASGLLRGCEALVRWRHPQRGLIPPDDFISFAEHSGLIRPLTRWVLKTAMQQARRWHDDGLEAAISVNLSMKDVEDHLPEVFARLLAQAGAHPSWLTVELTESVLMNDPQQTLEIVRQLDDMGLAISIDDFGTGYSSLAYLKQLPTVELKIDKSFIRDMLVDDSDAVIVRSTISLAHNLGIEVVAEGIEDAQQWGQLALAGCDVGQGYFISRPLPPADFEQWVAGSPFGRDAIR